MPKGVRLDPKHDERTRAKIQTSQIINRLMQLVNGEIEMNSQQVRAAEIMLKKTLPDLSAIECNPVNDERDPWAEMLKYVNEHGEPRNPRKQN